MIRFLQTEVPVINFVIFCVFRGIITRTRHYYGDSKSQGTGVIAQNYGGGYSGEEQSRKVRLRKPALMIVIIIVIFSVYVVGYIKTSPSRNTSRLGQLSSLSYNNQTFSRESRL